MKNIEDLRDHLFATLEALRDKDNPMDIARAKTISEVAQTVINSAKAEVDYMKVTGAKGSGFIPDVDDTPKLVDNTPKPPTPGKEPRVRTHLLR